MNSRSTPLPLLWNHQTLCNRWFGYILQDDEPSDHYNEERKEAGGPRGKEPTRFGDWEQKGRCTDF